MIKPFPSLGSELNAAGYMPPSYSAMWQNTARGIVPQIIRRGYRLYFDTDDLAAIAEALGLQAKEEVKLE